MMIEPTNNQQGAAQRRGRGSPMHWRVSAAPSVVDDQFQAPARPILLGRVHCRGLSTPRTFYSTLTRGGVQPAHAVALLQSLMDQFACKAAVGPEVFHFVERLSSLALDGINPIDTEGRERGHFIQGRGGPIQERGPRHA